MKPSKSGKSLHAFVGTGINGKPFDGSKMKSGSGAKTYSHLNFVKKGNAFVSRPAGRSVFRAAGQSGAPNR
jgi:hypothetical protein